MLARQLNMSFVLRMNTITKKNERFKKMAFCFEFINFLIPFISGKSAEFLIKTNLSYNRRKLFNLTAS